MKSKHEYQLEKRRVRLPGFLPTFREVKPIFINRWQKKIDGMFLVLEPEEMYVI